MEWRPNKDCEKCSGAGWLWARELDVYHGKQEDMCWDDTRYTCDGEAHYETDKS